MNKTLGAIPSPLDIRDIGIMAYATVLSDFGRSFDIVPEHLMYEKNQENIPSCVGHVASYDKDITEYLQTRKMENHSPGFIYANRKDTVTELLGNEGMVPRDAAKKIVRDGAVLYEDFPYNDFYKNLKDKITPELLKKAYPRRASAFYYVTNEFEVKTALTNGHAVWTMVPIYASFYKPNAKGLVPIPNKNKERFDGYHEILITGWREEGYRFINSWGNEWGDNKFGILPYDYPIQEMMVITDEVNRFSEEVKQMYKDGEMIAPWAAEAVAELNKLGLMSGDGVNFRPLDNITRQEAAVLIYRLYEKLKV